MNISDPQFVNVTRLYEPNIALSFLALKSGCMYPQKCRSYYVVYIHFIKEQ